MSMPHPAYQKYAAVLFAVLLLLQPKLALAQCENPGTALPPLIAAAAIGGADITSFFLQEKNFITKDLDQTAAWEVMTRLDELDTNTRNWFGHWINNRYARALQHMQSEISLAKAQQTTQLSLMEDAQRSNEMRRALSEKEIEGAKKIQPTDLACQMDTVAPKKLQAKELSYAMNSAVMNELIAERTNPKGVAAGFRDSYKDYTELFCDTSRNDPGCEKTGPLANKTIASVMFGSQQTIDPKDPNNMALLTKLPNTLFPPIAEPAQPTAMGSSGGQAAVLEQRKQAAREMAMMFPITHSLSKRLGGSGADMQVQGRLTGTPATKASADASPNEIAKTMSARMRDPSFMMSLTRPSASLQADMTSMTAHRLQRMQDYNELMDVANVAKAAELADKLDTPQSNASSSIPVSK